MSNTLSHPQSPGACVCASVCRGSASARDVSAGARPSSKVLIPQKYGPAPDWRLRQSPRYSTLWPAWIVCVIAIMITIMLVAEVACARDAASRTPAKNNPASSATRTPSKPQLFPFRVRLFPRAEASNTHINEPPTPPGGFPPPVPLPLTTRPPSRTTNSFPLRPSGDDPSTVGQGPKPTGLDAASHDRRDEWGPVRITNPQTSTSDTSTTSNTSKSLSLSLEHPLLNSQVLSVAVRDPFHNIWAPTDIPQPGDPVTTFPPATPPIHPPQEPFQPTAPAGPFIALPSQPTATPTFSAIPIVPIGISARTNASDRPPAPKPNRNTQSGVCGNGYCSADESCSTCPLDCSLAHGDYLLKLRAGLRHEFLFGTGPVLGNVTQYTFECGLGYVAQFCPRAPGTNRTRAMVAVTGYHPGQLTRQLSVMLKAVPPQAVIVFLELAVLMDLSAETEAASAACDLVFPERKYTIGISLGSVVFAMVDGVSTGSLTLAAQALQALPSWCAARQRDNKSLRAFIQKYPAGFDRPLYISVDPGSAYRAAVLDPSVPQLLASFNARLVVPSLPVNEAHLPGSVVNHPETATYLVRTAITKRPGISGWIVGVDGSSQAASLQAIPRVIQELEKHVEWVSDVGQCLEYDAKAGGERAAARATGNANAINEQETKRKSPVLRMNEVSDAWVMDMSVWGAEVEAVSMDESHMPGGFFN